MMGSLRKLKGFEKSFFKGDIEILEKHSNKHTFLEGKFVDK